MPCLETCGGESASGLGRTAVWEEPAPLLTSQVEQRGQQLTNSILFILTIIIIIIIYSVCGMCVFMCMFGGVYICEHQGLMTSSVSITHLVFF